MEQVQPLLNQALAALETVKNIVRSAQQPDASLAFVMKKHRDFIQAHPEVFLEWSSGRQPTTAGFEERMHATLHATTTKHNEEVVSMVKQMYAEFIETHPEEFCHWAEGEEVLLADFKTIMKETAQKESNALNERVIAVVEKYQQLIQKQYGVSERIRYIEPNEEVIERPVKDFAPGAAQRYQGRNRKKNRGCRRVEPERVILKDHTQLRSYLDNHFGQSSKYIDTLSPIPDGVTTLIEATRQSIQASVMKAAYKRGRNLDWIYDPDAPPLWKALAISTFAKEPVIPISHCSNRGIMIVSKPLRQQINGFQFLNVSVDNSVIHISSPLLGTYP